MTLREKKLLVDLLVFYWPLFLSPPCLVGSVEFRMIAKFLNGYSFFIALWGEDQDGMGIMDIHKFWMSAKIGWLRKLKTKDYDEPRRTNNIHHQPDGNTDQKNTDTKDWLKMLICELIKLSEDLSPTPTKIITSWGTAKMRTIGLKKKNKFWKAVFTGIKELEDGFYYTHPQYLGEMVIWGTQNIRTGGMQLNAGGIHSIANGRNRDETGITTINHLINPVGKSIYTDTQESNKIKTKAQIQAQTGKELSDNEYQGIIRAVQHYLQTKGTSV